MTELWQCDVGRLSDLFEGRRATPRELLQSVRSRCEAVNPALNAIVAVDWEAAEVQARASEERLTRGTRLGPLDGIPLTVKDNIFVKGFAATWGSRLYRDFRPDADDLPVRRLRAAGAIILGKTNTPEFALAPFTDNLLFGATRNPWNIALTPGGSSGGAAAAVAAGLGPVAVATDAGGSIRRPASYTGVVGFKPTLGRVRRTCGFPALASDFQTIGPLARTVADARLLFDAMRGIAGPRLEAARKSALAPPRVRVLSLPEGGAIEPVVAATVDRTAGMLGEMGYRVERSPPPFDLREIEEIWATLSAVGLARTLAATEHAADAVTSATRALGERGNAMSGVRYLRALDGVRAIRERFRRELRKDDLLLSCASTALPWPVGAAYPERIADRPASPRAAAVFATFVNAAGLPAISVPGPTDGALPIGVQLTAAPGNDALLFRVAAELEAVVGWTGRWPDTDGMRR